MIVFVLFFFFCICRLLWHFHKDPFACPRYIIHKYIFKNNYHSLFSSQSWLICKFFLVHLYVVRFSFIFFVLHRNNTCFTNTSLLYYFCIAAYFHYWWFIIICINVWYIFNVFGSSVSPLQKIFLIYMASSALCLVQFQFWGCIFNPGANCFYSVKYIWFLDIRFRVN